MNLQSQLRRVRSGWIVAISIGAVALLALGTVPWRISRATVQRSVADSAQLLGPTELRVAGRSRLRLLPVPHLDVERVAIDYRAGTMRAIAQSAEVSLSLLSLLAGRIEPSGITLAGFEAQASGTVDSPVSLVRQMIAVAGAAVPASKLKTIRITSGRLSVAAVDGDTKAFEDLTGLWKPGERESDFSLDASGTWQGKPLALHASGPSTPHEQKAPASLIVKTDALSLQFDGSIFGGAEGKVDGQVDLTVSDGREVLRWLAQPKHFPGRIDRLSLSATLSGTGRQLAMSNAVLTLNGDRYDGVIGLRMDSPHPALSATLASDSVDLTGQLAFLMPKQAPDGAWSRDRFDSSALDAIDLDLRLSARRLRVAGLDAQRAALSVLLRAGRFELSLAEATVAEGAAKGRIVVARTAAGDGTVDARAHLSIDQADVGALLDKALAFHRIAGRGNVLLSVETSGNSTGALMDRLDGQTSLNLADGAILGIDLDRLLLRVERRSLLAAIDVPVGRTPFDSAVLSARISRGNFTISQCSFLSRSLNVQLTGMTEAPSRQLDFGGVVAANDQSGRKATVPFSIRGTWRSPRITAKPDQIELKL